MPRNIERDKREADRRKNQLIEAGFRLFSQNGIETVSLQKVADAANVSPATMYKYFLTKEKLLIAISAKVWDEVWQEALGDPGTNHFEHFTAYQGIEFYADRMIALYKNRPEVLRFSGEYKTYMNRRGNMEDKQLREHLDVLKPMQLLFHGMYERAKVDGSIRTDIPEEEMFITSSITMLSMAERYAQGLVWLNDPKDDHGYTELILYDASLQAGMQENGKPYICYGFFKQPVYYADYISQVVTAHTMMLASFSFSTIQSGTLQISDVERFMTLADDRKAANELRYVDLNSAFQAVADQNTTQQERQESYEKYEAEQEKRIQELEEKISAIYSRWDEY